jgi:hypothetical protein
MERFWIFLEAMARLLDNGKATEPLRHELSQMPATDRERMQGYLTIVTENLPHLMMRSPTKESEAH